MCFGLASMHVVAHWHAFHVLPAGPSISTDTACSSSLVSAHQAHKGLLSHETVAALAGGVNTMLLPITTASICGLGALSPTARCKTLDKSADGYGRGEGVGVVALAPLHSQSRVTKQPFAFMCGSAVNQDGRSSGLTAPNGPSQTALVAEVYATGAGLIGDAGYMSLHGTGGDSQRASAACCAIPTRWSTAKRRHAAGRPNRGERTGRSTSAPQFKPLIGGTWVSEVVLWTHRGHRWHDRHFPGVPSSPTPRTPCRVEPSMRKSLRGSSVA